MKTVKNSTSKKTKKAVKPAYIIDITEAESAEDILLVFAACKITTGADKLIPSEEDVLMKTAWLNTMTNAINELSKDNRIWVIGCNSVILTPCVDGPIAVKLKPMKKPNIFKRFWNWITRKK